MSYVFAENEFSEPTSYVQKMWELQQIERRSPHLPANKAVLLDSMYDKLFSVYLGLDNETTFKATIYNALLDPDEAVATNAALVYFAT
jgi:hypothetical protein